MSICWYCHWGWAKPVSDIYERALSKLDGDYGALDYGPGHIVWADENWDHAEWCIEHFDEYAEDLSPYAREVAMQALVELAALPLEMRDPCPEEYGGENPEMFPPPAGAELVRR